MPEEMLKNGAFRALGFAVVVAASQVPLIAAVANWWENARQHLGLTAFVVLAYEAGVFALAFGKKVWNRLEPEVVEVSADRVKVFTVTLLSGFRRRYKQQVIRDHSVFNVRGLGLVNTYTLSLNQVFVDLRIHPSNPQKFNRDLIAQSDVSGNRPVWDFLRSTQSKASEATALAIIGPPGCGKTTLLQHMAVTLAGNRQRFYRVRAYIPVLLFLRDQIESITQEDSPALGKLVQGYFDNRKLFATLKPPPGWFEARLERGGCMVLLDGLDEVAELQQRKAVSAWVDNQIKDYPRCRFILTARPQGYLDAPLQRAHVLDEVLIGDAAAVRRLAKRRQKNDRRDAGLILDLLLKGEFPQVYRPSFESREVLRLLRYRHKLVQMRTRAKNSLRALAFSAGSSGRSRLLSRQGRERFVQLPMSEAMGRQRDGWLSLVDELSARIKSLDAWLGQQAKRDERVLRLQTHPGIGLLTSLALVHALEPVSRFTGGRKVAAYVGLDPVEHSSADRQRFGMKRTDESNVTCLSAASGRPMRSRTVAFSESEDYCLLPPHDKHTSGQRKNLLTNQRLLGRIRALAEQISAPAVGHSLFCFFVTADSLLFTQTDRF